MTLAILINHDELSLINGIGLVICLGGITLHVVLKVNQWFHLWLSFGEVVGRCEILVGVPL